MPFAKCCWCAIRIPRHGRWRSRPACRDEVTRKLDGEYVGVFIPTTPSPVNGFYFYVRKADTIELDISVDVALKSIISMGVVPSRRSTSDCPNPICNPSLLIFPKTESNYANSLLRTTQRFQPRPDRHPVRLGTSPPRPRRGDFHRPARPRRTGAGGVRSRSRRDVRHRRIGAQRIRVEGHRPCAPPPGRHRQPQHSQRRDRNAVPRDRGAEHCRSRRRSSWTTRTCPKTCA